MARLDLYRLDGTLVIDLQHDLLEHLPTRVVAPLLPPERAGRPVRNLHPAIEFEGQPHLLATHLLAAVPKRALGPSVGKVDAQHDRVLRAVEVLMLSGL